MAAGRPGAQAGPSPRQKDTRGGGGLSGRFLVRWGFRVFYQTRGGQPGARGERASSRGSQ